MFNRALRCPSEKPPKIAGCVFILLVVKAIYENANPIAGFGQCRVETFRVDAQESDTQRLDGVFFRKTDLVLKH